MFAKFSVLTVFLAVLASRTAALTLNAPANISSGGSVTISWTSASGDPGLFSLELVNEVFHNSFAIANNVETATGSITLGLPIVPSGDGYTLEAVNVTDINDVYSNTGDFSIAPTVTTSSGSTTAMSFGMSTTVMSIPTSSGTNSATSSSSSSSSGSSTSSAPTSSASNFNGAAALPIGFGIAGAGTYAVVLLSAIAGAAMVAL